MTGACNVVFLVLYWVQIQDKEGDMAFMIELLEALRTKAGPVNTADLAKELQASKEGTLKQLTRARDSGNVSGTSQEGWEISDAGKEALEKGDIQTSMIDEGVTPRQQFEAIGRLIGIKQDRIVLATNMVWSGDYEDIDWVAKALGREGADLADDLRRVWTNSWRAKLQKGIPPGLEAELCGVSKEGLQSGNGAEPGTPGDREYIIVDEQPVRVGQNLGDYGLQDAKDILAIRAMRSRFNGTGQSDKANPPGAAEKVSEVLAALEPYINKGTDMATLKEVLADKLELQKQDILSRIPQQGPPAQAKTFLEQITDLTSILGTLKDSGPTLRAILGIPESSGNPSTGLPVRIKGPDGEPLVMDLGQVIDWQRFQSSERRADERHGALVGLAQTVRENVSDGVAALKAAAEEARPSGKDTTSSAPEPQVFDCGACHVQFSAPPEWKGEPIKCPNPECGREYSKEELLA